MKKIFSITVLLIMMVNLSIAQEMSETTEVEVEEVTPAIGISGSVDAYFRNNLNADFDYAPGTSFANLPGFALGMANVVIAQEGSNFGFTADLVFGPRGEDATFLSGLLRPSGNGFSNNSSIVNQLYAYWAVSDAFKLTLGNFNTFLGYEVISPTGNFNYSTSYMFSYGPFSHTGLKADVSFDSGLSLMAGIFNPTDATEFNPTNNYAFGAQVGYEAGGLGIWLNGLFSGADDELGTESFTQFDITAGYDISETIYVGLNATTASDSFTGFAGYFQVATSDALKLGLRVENFEDNGLGLFTVDESVLNFTVSANYKVGNLTLIPEIRIDSFSEDIVPDDGELSGSLSSFVLAAVYGF